MIKFLCDFIVLAGSKIKIQTLYRTLVSLSLLLRAWYSFINWSALNNLESKKEEETRIRFVCSNHWLEMFFFLFFGGQWKWNECWQRIKSNGKCITTPKKNEYIQIKNWMWAKCHCRKRDKIMLCAYACVWTAKDMNHRFAATVTRYASAPTPTPPRVSSHIPIEKV